MFFLSFKNLPWLVGGPSAAQRPPRLCWMSEAVTRRLMGLLKSQSQLTLFLRFLFAWGGGRRWAKFPLPGTPFPPFFTWRTPTRPSRPISSGVSSRKPFLMSQAVDPICSVLPFFCLSSQRSVCGCRFPSVSPPQQTVSSLRAGPGVVCLSVPCAAPAWPRVGVQNVWCLSGVVTRDEGTEALAASPLHFLERVGGPRGMGAYQPRRNWGEELRRPKTWVEPWFCSPPAG